MVNVDKRLDHGIIECPSVGLSDAPIVLSANGLVLPYLYPENLLQPIHSVRVSELSFLQHTMSC